MLIKPRLTDFHGIHIPQHELDFAIPFFHEDIPLYLDPFLLWRSPSQQDQSLHQTLLNGFNHLGILKHKGKEEDAINQLIIASECDEVGLGTSAKRSGKRIGKKTASEVLDLFHHISFYAENGFRHFEEIQLFVDGIGKDRVSDIACSFLKSFLIDFTIDQAKSLGIPANDIEINHVYCMRSRSFIPQKACLPINPENGKPLLLVPKRWLRHVPWINYDQYFRDYCPQDDIAHEGEELARVQVLNYSRDNYGVVDSYIKDRERTFEDCHNDPLFSQIPIISAKRELAKIRRLSTGKNDGADRKYEKAIGRLFPSLFYPHLDFADEQSRTDSGVSIRDLIFFNSQSHEFLRGILEEYGSKQITMEMKNVAKIDRAHIDQINRYLNDSMGKFGILVTRTALKKAEWRRTIDLWSGQRKSIVTITDEDVSQMVELFESKQRQPIDVIKKKYLEFRRACPD